MLTKPITLPDQEQEALNQPIDVGCAENITLAQNVQAHLQHYFAAHSNELPPPGLYERVLRLVEKPLIETTLAATGGNQLKTAHILGINRNTLRKKIAELAIRLTDRG